MKTPGLAGSSLIGSSAAVIVPSLLESTCKETASSIVSDALSPMNPDEFRIEIVTFRINCYCIARIRRLRRRQSCIGAADKAHLFVGLKWIERKGILGTVIVARTQAFERYESR